MALRKLNVLVYALATWRLTQMLVSEDGPGRIFFKLRQASGIEYSTTESDQIVSWNDWTPLTCTKCASVWVAVALGFAPNWFRRFLAASAVSVIIDAILEHLEHEEVEYGKG